VLFSCRIELRELRVQGLQLILHFAKVGEDTHALGKHRASSERESVLWQIALADAFGVTNRPVIERLHPVEDLEQRRFASPIASDNTGALFGSDQPVAVLEEKFVAESFSGALELDHADESLVRFYCGRFCEIHGVFRVVVKVMNLPEEWIVFLAS